MSYFVVGWVAFSLGVLGGWMLRSIWHDDPNDGQGRPPSCQG